MKITDMVVFSNRNINFPKYERFSVLPKRESRSLFGAKWKNGSTPSIYVSDYKTAGEIIRVAYTFCFGAYVRFNTESRFKLCQGAKYFFLWLLQQWGADCAAGSFAENGGGEWHRWCGESDIASYLPIRKWLSSFMHAITKDHLYQCVSPATVGKGHVPIGKTNSFTLCYIFLWFHHRLYLYSVCENSITFLFSLWFCLMPSV